MKILILLPHPIESPGPRFRIYQYLPYFKQAGIEYTISAFLNSEEYMNIYNGPATSFLEKSNAAIKGIARQIHAIADIKSYDGVIVYREAILVGRPWIERYIVKKGIPIIFDFDDAIWMPVKSQTGISPILKRLIKSTKKFDEIMQLSTHIVAGNNYLAQHAQLLNKHVSVIPTVVDTDYYKPSTAKQNRDDIVIGWIGSGSTSVYLKLLDNIWSRLQSPTLPKRDNTDVIKRSPSLFKEGQGEFKVRSNSLSPSLSKRDAADEPQHNLVLKIIGGTYNPIGIHTNNIKWSLDTELAEMSEFDIGIMPLPDDEWAKGKCGLKILQYMAMGIPCVASPVGVNTEIIQDGVNGFLAKDEKEWIEKLTLLIENPELRQRLGRAGRKTVEDRYSVKVWAPGYVEIIKKVIDIDKSESSIQKKIEILYLTTSSKIGGAEQVILALAKNIDHALFDIEVCILSPKGALNEELDRLKVKNFALGIKNWFYVPGAVYKLYRLLKRKQYDIINTWLFHASVMGVFITLIKTSPIIESRQYADYMYKYNFKLKQILDRIASHNVDHIIACSNAAKEILTHYEKVDTRKITVIYNGTNIDEFRLYNINKRRQIRENLKVEDKIVLSFTAHLRPAKGHQYLLEAISKIKNQYTNIVLLLIGEGVLRNELEALTRQLNIEDNVRFLGYRTDIPDILSATDIYVHPSVEEGFGISIIEAMAVGLPVIATNVGGIPEIITNGENGILVPPENSQALAEAISDLIAHPDKRKALAENGKQRVVTNFTDEIMVKKYMEVYRNIINQKNSVRRKINQ